MHDDAEWSLYVIRTADNTFYTGISTNPQRRFKQHCSGSRKAARYFKLHAPEELVMVQKIGSRSEALKAEHRFKNLDRTLKEKIIHFGHFEFKSINK